MSTGKDAVQEAAWLGTYHHQGRVKGVGVDCGTLICEVYEKGLMDHLDPTISTRLAHAPDGATLFRTHFRCM